MAKANKQEQGLKILGLKAQGFRKLTAIDIPLVSSGLIQIKGKNKQGKTSILDTVEWLIKGNKTINKDIIQHGKEKATAELKLGNYIISRTITAKSQRLEVRNTETNQVLSGEVQNFLTELINESTFNSRSFLDKTPIEQLKFCFKLFNIDFSSIDKQLETLEADRLICGRERDKFGDLDESKPEKIERVDTATLFQQRKEIEEINAGLREDYQRSRDNAISEIEAFNKEQRDQAKAIEVEENNYNRIMDNANLQLKEIERLKKELREAENKLEIIHENAEDCEKSLAHLKKHLPLPEKPLVADVPEPTYESLADLDEQIQNANAINVKAEAYAKWEQKKKEKAEKEQEYQAYNTKINSLRKQKLDKLTSINTGVAGLEIREDGLYYNNTYSDNWSDMEGIRIASELCLAQNPPLRAVFIDRFESFDREARAEIEKWAIEKDVQIIVTKVEDEIPEEIDENNVFYVEEGLIVKSNVKTEAIK